MNSRAQFAIFCKFFPKRGFFRRKERPKGGQEGGEWRGEERRERRAVFAFEPTLPGKRGETAVRKEGERKPRLAQARRGGGRFYCSSIFRMRSLKRAASIRLMRRVLAGRFW